MESPIINAEEFIRKKELKKSEFPKTWNCYDDDIIDGRPTNASIRKLIADDFIVSDMKSTEQKYTSYLGMDIWIGTWNVNGKKIDEDITEWLCAGGANHTDIFVIGLEEMVDLTASTVVSESQSQRRSQIWLEKIASTLQSNYRQEEDQYYCVSSKILVGVFMCIFARVSLKPCIKNIMTSSVATGLLGMMGNKGGVGIRMDINNSSIAFICSHLAAHREKVAERNADYRRIVSEMRFSPADTSSEGLTIKSHDIVIWLGDLNYRIVSDVPNNVIFEYAKKNYLALLKKDQLLVSKKAGFAFEGFEEPDITFPPTYKYIRQTSMYDERTEKKVRAPSWCDRILYYIRDKDPEKQCPVTVTDYSSVQSLITSDHKPVYMRAVLLVKKYDEEIMMQAKKQAEEKLLVGELMEKPSVQVTTMEVPFNQLHYKTHSRKIVSIQNTGAVNAYFYFIPRDANNTVSIPVFSVSEFFGIVLPGETKEIVIDACVTLDSLHCVRENGRIEDMLAVRIDNHSDFYFHLTGLFLSTSFGKSLKELVHMKESARANEIIDLKSTANQVIPFELWSMVDYIFKNGLLTANLWKEQSTEEELHQVRELIDTRSDIKDVDVHTVANVLTEWLHSLKTPIFPKDLIEGLSFGSGVNCHFADTFLAMLPRENRNVFIYIMKFLQELLKHAQWNQLDREFLTIVFSRVLIGDYLNNAEENREQVVAQNVIVNMIRFLLTSAEEEEELIKRNEGESDSE